MLSRRFLAAAFGTATLIGTVGLAVLPGAASAGSAARGGVTVHRVAAADNVKPGGPIVPAAVSGHASAQVAGQKFSVAEQSVNWSGFAVTSSKKFTYAQSRFVQPTLTCPGDHANEWSSNWVGFDGFNPNSQTVEQDGTAAHCGGAANKTPVYKAWYEMYPKGSVNVFSVKPGDTINTSVSYSNGKFTLTVADLTSHQSSTHTATCASCKRNSAEWIVERPALCTSHQLLHHPPGRLRHRLDERQGAGGRRERRPGHPQLPELPHHDDRLADRQHSTGHDRQRQQQHLPGDLGRGGPHGPARLIARAAATHPGPEYSRMQRPPPSRSTAYTMPSAVT